MAYFKNKNQNSSRQRRWTLLQRLDNMVMRSDVDPHVFLSEVFQLRGELSNLSEVASNERLTSIILDALPEEKYSPIKVQAMTGPGLGLGEIMNMVEIIFINYSESSSVLERSQEPYR